MEVVIKQMRLVILGTLVVCLAVAMAPWFSGGQDPVAMLTSGFALLLGALLVWRQLQARRLQRGPLVISFVVLIGFAMLSLLWSANRYSTALWVAEWVLAGLAFWLAYVVAGEPKGREWVVRAYMGSAAVFCVVALWMYLTAEYNRLTGTFYWANPAAAYLLPAIVTGLDRTRRAVGRTAVGWAAITIIMLASFLLTDSRAATLVLTVIMVLYLLVSTTPKAFWIKFVFVLGLGISLSIGLNWLSTITAQHRATIVPGSRFAEAAKGESSSLRDRLYYLGSAFEMWFAHPVGGIGAGAYGDVHPQYQQQVVSASSSAHNMYIQVLAELGLMGAAALASVLLWLFAGVFKGLVTNSESLPIALGGLGLLLHFGLDIDAKYPALLILAAVLFGLVYRQWGQVRGRVSWRPVAVAMLVLVPVVSLYLSETAAARGRIAQENNDYTGAARWFAAAHYGLVYNPDYVTAEGIDLYALAAGGGPDAKNASALALDRAHEAERLDPHDGQHYQFEGRVLALRGDLAGAERALREALRLDPYNHPDYALDLAAVQVRAGHPDAGLATAEAMIKLYPSDVVANRNADTTLRPTLANLGALVGNVYLGEGKAREAKAAAERALALDKTSLRGRALMHQIDRATAPR